MIHEPDLLILDEPFSGLDPVSTRLLREQILAEHRRGATVLFSTHVMPQAEEICDHVVMIHRGQKMLDDPVSTILRPHDSRALKFEPLEPRADVSAVRALPEVERCTAADGGYEVALRDGADAGARHAERPRRGARRAHRAQAADASKTYSSRSSPAAIARPSRAEGVAA